MRCHLRSKAVVGDGVPDVPLPLLKQQLLFYSFKKEVQKRSGDISYVSL